MRFEPPRRARPSKRRYARSRFPECTRLDPPWARGALERRGRARRLTRAWSWRAPVVGVELRLCASPYPDPAGAGAPARIAPAAQAQAVRLNTNIKTESFLSQCSGHRGCRVHGRPRRGALGAARCGAPVSAQRGLLTSRGRSGRQPVARGLVRWAPGGRSAQGKVCGGEFREGSA